MRFLHFGTPELNTVTNEFERTCKIFLSGCSCTTGNEPEVCAECLKGFLDRIKSLTKTGQTVVDPFYKKSTADLLRLAANTIERESVEYVQGNFAFSKSAEGVFSFPSDLVLFEKI